MDFDEVLRQGRQMQEAADQQAREAQAQRDADAEAEARFRQSLRDLGTWFAGEARTRRLPTVPFYVRAPEEPPPPVQQGWLRSLFTPPPPPPRPPAPVARGWALFPLHPCGDGTIHRGRSRRYGGRLYFDEVVGGVWASMCLAVDTSGGIRVGAAAESVEPEDFVVIGRNGGDDVMGLEPDELTRNQLVAVVNDLDVPPPPGFRPGDPTWAMMLDASADSSRLLRDEIVGYYAARAHQMLDGR